MGNHRSHDGPRKQEAAAEKEKRGTSKSYTYFVEYWKEGGKPL